jgi:DNA modification methylase
MTTIEDVLAGRERSVLHLGDCRDVHRATPDESIDLAVTDPPYGIAHDSNHEGSEWAKQIVGDDAVYADWLPDVARMLKTGAALYLFTRWDVEGEWIAAVRSAGLRVVQVIVWGKWARERVCDTHAGDRLNNVPICSAEYFFSSSVHKKIVSQSATWACSRFSAMAY